MMYQSEEETYGLNPKVSPKRFWFAFYTKPKHEFKAAQYLSSMEIEHYLPTITTLKQWSDRKKKVTEPLFRGYIFVYCNEKERYESLQNDALLSTVSFEGKPAHIPDWQIENLKKLLAEKREVFVQNKMEVGTKVKITDGPFNGVTGIVSQTDEHGRVLGVTIDLLRRSVLVKLPDESVIQKIIES